MCRRIAIIARIAVMITLTLLAWKNVLSGQPHPFAEASPLASVAECTDHSPTVWHAVVKKDAGGAIVCSYGHEHGDNPHLGDARFGGFPFPSEVSHPWETDQENATKHQFNKWMVATNMACVQQQDSLYGMTDLRGQVHFDGHPGAKTRVHSYSVEVKLCKPGDPSYSGYARFGGHADTGRLMVTQDGVDTHVVIPEDSHATCGDATQSGLRRIHAFTQTGGQPYPSDNSFWYYGNHRCSSGAGPKIIHMTNLGATREQWARVSPTPSAINNPVLWFGGTENASHQETWHSLSFSIPRNTFTTSLIQNGVITWSGFTNRYGQQATVCTAPGPDCVPVVIQNMEQTAQAHYRSAGAGSSQVHEFDVVDPATGQSLIVYPN